MVHAIQPSSIHACVVMQFSPVNNVNNVNVANYPSSLTCTRIYIVYTRVRIPGQISLMILAHLSDYIISFGYERKCASACGATVTRFMALPIQALALCMQAPGYVVFTLRMHIVLCYLCLLSWGPTGGQQTEFCFCEFS